MYEGNRLVLRYIPGVEQATKLAVAADWTLLWDNAGKPYRRHTHEQEWGVRRGLHVRLLSDELSDMCALSVLMEDRAAGAEFERLLIEHLNPLTRQELLEPIISRIDPSERMMRLMRLVLGAPAYYDQEFYEPIAQLAEDPDPRVRDAVVLACGYLEWFQLRAILRRMADQDPHPEVRRDAMNTLVMRDNTNVPPVHP
ncbi:hypothetical protein EDD27_7648 [Nonomuraea polychroma]|uniref:HEAT repeat protein n=1 Tax=Nonomuraea polychroma TaxID=46176 RepID=A0A438MGG7_9ACTN|nr:HEAT repeat domain-containing protein [Nonomuraea polychroma]RVX44883.1 hypothetical protein EDD27_7648 [Nonomuraea polychroma]